MPWKESRKKYANFVIFWSQFLGGNPRRRGLMEMLWGLIIKQEELYFRVKSKSYLINNQELAPFSLDNLKMFFHMVRGLFNSRKWKNSFVEKENLSLIFVCLRFFTGWIGTRKATQNAEGTTFLTPVIFRVNRLKGGADRGVVYFIDRSYPK